MRPTGLTPVEVPDIGDFDEVPIIEILVKPGDAVAPEDPLVTLESDKATMDVPAPFAGIVRELHVAVGDRVSQGTVLLSMEAQGTAGDSVASAVQAEQDSAPAAPASPPPVPAPGGTGATPPQPGGAVATPPRPDGADAIYASPAVRKIARERGIDLRALVGSGRKGRITKEDLESPGAGAPPAAAPPSAAPSGLNLPPWPVVDFSRFGEVERVPRSRIQRISGPNLARNWVMIPHVTHHDEADITELEAWRRSLNEEHARAGPKVTMVSFLVLACVAALKEFPQFNASLDGDELVLKRYYNIGFAADTPGGLVVPVIKSADAKGLLEIAGELTTLSTRAREGKLTPGDMQGATFTISSLGGIGGTAFTPIINAPEVAILGATRSAMRPVWDGSTFVPRLMLPLSLSYDHRVIDGAAAARFTVFLTRVLGDLRRALL